MIVGLYMIVPFLRKIVIDEKLAKYFLILAFFFAFAVPEIISIIKVLSAKYGTKVQSIVDQAKMFFVLGFPAYFILGYYLNENNISPKTEKMIYSLGIAGFIITVLGNVVLAHLKKKPTLVFFDNNTLNVLFEVVCIFTFFKQKVNKNHFKESTIHRLSLLSKYSFGAYLVHPFFITFLAEILHLHASSFNPIVAIPFVSILVSILSFASSAVLNRIPIVNKYFV